MVRSKINTNIKSVFLCDSQYQLLSVCNIIQMNKIYNESIIYIIDMFDGCSQIVKKIRSKGFTIQMIHLGHHVKIFCVFKFIFKCIIEHLKINNLENIYISSQNGYAILFYYLMSNNNNINLIFYDEGLYSYVNDFCRMHPFDEYFFHHRIFKLIFSNRKFNYNRIVYLYNYNYAAINEHVNYRNILMSKNLSDMFLDHIINPKLIDCEIIILDQYFLADSNEYKIYQKILGEFSSEKIKKSVVLKKHPRNNYFDSSLTYSGVIIKNDTNLWEAEIPYINRNKTLVTFYSSAVFMPHILYDYNFKTILLYKMILNTNDYLYRMLEEFIKRFAAYNSNIEIYTPESLDELRKVIGIYEN